MSKFEPIDLQAATGSLAREWKWDEPNPSGFWPLVVFGLPGWLEEMRKRYGIGTGVDAAGWPLRDGPEAP